MHVYDHTEHPFTHIFDSRRYAITMREIDARAIGRREYPGSKLSELAYETAFSHPSLVWC